MNAQDGRHAPLTHGQWHSIFTKSRRVVVFVSALPTVVHFLIIDLERLCGSQNLWQTMAHHVRKQRNTRWDVGDLAMDG
jgi:hypothetical protein